MPLKKNNELNFSNKKLKIMIMGRANCGKTTLALSARNVLLIDLESGISRTEACYRKDVFDYLDVPDNQKYEALMQDLKTVDLTPYEAIAVDSFGKFMDIASYVVKKENQKNVQKDGKTLSQQGYGALGQKAVDFMNLIESLGKHTIWIVHTTEIKTGDVYKSRVDIVGSTKDRIWKDLDLAGYINYRGLKRIISFTPCEEFDAKGSHGIFGDKDIPELKTTQEGGKLEDNHFLQDLIDIYINNLNEEQKIYSQDYVIYQNAISKCKPLIESSTNEEELNAAYVELKQIDHALTSKRELWSACETKAKELGLKYVSESGTFTKPTEN